MNSQRRLRPLLSFVLLTLLGASACKTGAPPNPVVAAPVPTSGPLQDAPEMDWWRRSMQTKDERLRWFRDARFGMFVHFGVYSLLGGVWQGQPAKPYAEHIQRIMKIPGEIYRENVAQRFNPTEFNADEWCAAAKSAGMQYLVITSKHHDGFAMWDSDVSPYNVVKASAWKRDPMRALKDACSKQGIHFGFYYSQAWDWEAAGAPGEGWGYKRPGDKGDKTLDADARWYAENPQLAEKMRHYVDTKAIPQVKELIAKYDPEIIWFDTPAHMPVAENLRILKAAREAKPTLVINSRITQGLPGGPRGNFGDYQSTTDKPAEFPPNDGDWEGIPTTNESYAWHKMDDSHKPPAHFIGLLAKAAARGGNVLLNIGPTGTGKFDPKDSKILEGIGAWMKVNGDSIHGTTRSPLAVQAWGESTQKGNTLYLHVLEWPRKGRIVVGGLKSNVKKAYLLADARRAPLKFERAGALDVIVRGPATAPDSADSVIALELDGDVAVDHSRVLSTDVPMDILRAFDGVLSGGLKCGSGKARDSYVLNWDKPDETVSWPARVRDKATYEVALSYEADAKTAGSTFNVKVGSQTLAGTVAPSTGAPVVLGKVTVDPGKLDIAVEPTKIAGPELMKLRALTLTPAK